jgi:hypothetical protein
MSGAHLMRGLPLRYVSTERHPNLIRVLICGVENESRFLPFSSVLVSMGLARDDYTLNLRLIGIDATYTSCICTSCEGLQRGILILITECATPCA